METSKQEACNCGNPVAWRNISDNRFYCDACKNKQCSYCPENKKCDGENCWERL